MGTLIATLAGAIYTFLRFYQMVLSQDLKLQLKKLFQKRKFSEVEFLIENSIKNEDKSSGILNLLGASKINRNKKKSAQNKIK